jgi:thiol:disulfide interchange protein DsbD
MPTPICHHRAASAHAIHHLLATLALLLATAVCAAPTDAPAKPGRVEATLIAEPAAIVPGKPFRVALRLRHDAHWHTYWRNPGDAGLPTTLAWTLPAGFRAGEIEWPYPERLQRGPLASFGYTGEVLLTVPIYPPRTLPATTTLQAVARWLECDDNCIPQQAALALTLPAAGTAPVAAGAHAAAFRRARERRVETAAGLTATARIDGSAIAVTLALPAGMAPRGELFPEVEDVVEPGIVPTLEARPGGAVWRSQLTPNGRRRSGMLPAVWVGSAADGSRRGYRVDIALP